MKPNTAKLNYRPAGFSDSEDDDTYDGFSFGSSPKPGRSFSTNIEQSRFKSEDEQFYDKILSGDLGDLFNLVKNGRPKNFNLNKRLNNDWTPLMFACNYGDFNLVQLLVVAGANVNLLSKQMWTAVMTTCMPAPTSVEKPNKNVYDIIKYLIEHEAVLNCSDIKGRSTLMYACIYGPETLMKMLLPLTAIEAQDNEGNTALFHAISNKNTRIVDALIIAGANKNHVNNYGYTARDWAEANLYPSFDATFPIDEEYQLPDEYLSNSYYYQLAPTVFGNGKVPHFFSDVFSLLCGMNCSSAIEYFAKANVNLLEFLNITDERLLEIGIRYPIQRNRILHGLRKFHQRKWSPNSIRMPTEGDSMADTFSIMADGVKQSMILWCSIKYVQENNVSDDLCPFYENIIDLLKLVTQKTTKIKEIILEIDKKTVPPPLLIAEDHHKHSLFGQKFNDIKKTVLCTTLGAAVLTGLTFILVLKTIKFK